MVQSQHFIFVPLRLAYIGFFEGVGSVLPH